ncbi:MAG: hypothetical protein N7Q72_01685 [Spiroplasma sp. Tabriz.8]|nr:hypothetical protein [Spiroplasma sp. Tabriz.8]
MSGAFKEVRSWLMTCELCRVVFVPWLIYYIYIYIYIYIYYIHIFNIYLIKNYQ